MRLNLSGSVRGAVFAFLLEVSQGIAAAGTGPFIARFGATWPENAQASGDRMGFEAGLSREFAAAPWLAFAAGLRAEYLPDRFRLRIGDGGGTRLYLSESHDLFYASLPIELGLAWPNPYATPHLGIGTQADVKAYDNLRERIQSRCTTAGCSGEPPMNASLRYRPAVWRAHLSLGLGARAAGREWRLESLIRADLTPFYVRGGSQRSAYARYLLRLSCPL